MKSKFKMPNKFNTNNTVKTIREKLKATGDEVCINVATHMRDQSIREIDFNLKQTKNAWEMTLYANPSMDKKELAFEFVKASAKQNQNDRGQQFMTYTCLMLIGGDVSEFAKQTMIKK